MRVEAVALNARARARRRIVEQFCAQHAITPYDTIRYRPPAPLQPTFEAMIAERLIRREGDAYYWLDVAAYGAATASRRHRQVPIAIAVAILAALVLTLFYRG